MSVDAPSPTLEELITDIDRELSVGDAAGGIPEERTPSSRSKDIQLIKFLLGDLLLAVPLSDALEIGRETETTPLPNLPDWIPGVSNIRGEIISMVDLKAFFGLPSSGPSGNRRFIVLRSSEMKVGVLVDRIAGIFSTGRTDMAAREPLFSNAGSGAEDWAAFISNTLPLPNRAILHILDVGKLLSSSRMNAFDSR